MQAARFPPAPRRLATAQQLELEDSTLEYDLSRFDSVPTPSTAVAEKIFNDPNAWFGSTLAKFGESQERQNSLAASPEADKTTFVEVTPTSAISSAKPKSSSQSSTDSTESTDSTDSSVSIKPFTRKRTVLPESPTSSSSSSGRSSAAFWSSDGRSSGAESDITVDSDSAKLKPEALRASRLSISFFWSEKNLFRALPSPAAPSPLTPGAGFASLAKSTHLFVPGAPLPAQEMKQRRRSNSVDGFQFTVPPLKLSKRQNANSVPSSPIVEVQVEVPSPRNPDVQTLKIQNSLSAPPSPISTNAPLLESMTSPPAANSAPPSPLPTDAPMSLFQGSPRMRPTGPRLGPRPLPTPSGHRKSASLVSSNPSLLLASPVQSSAPLSDEKSSLPLGDPPPYTDAPGASASQQIPLSTTTTPSAPLRQARPNPSLVARPQSEFNSSEVESVPSIEEMRASVAALPMVPALRKRRSRAALSMAARPHSSVDPDAAATAGVQVSEGQGRLPLPGIPPSVPLPPLPPPIPQSGLPSRAMIRRPSVSRMQYKSEAQGQGQEQRPIVPVPLQNEPDLWPKPAPTLKSAMKKPSMDSATPPLPSMGFSRPQEQTLPRSESPAPIVAPTPSSSNPPIQMDLVNQKLEATGPAPSPASTLERGKSERGRRSPFPAAKRRGLPSRETSPSESVRSNSTTTTTTSSISEPVTRSVTPVQNGPFSSMGTQPVPTRSTTPVPLPPPVPSNPVQQQEIETLRPQPPSTVSTPAAPRPPQQPTPVPTPAPPQKPVSILRPTRSKSRIRFAEGVKTKTHGHSASQPDFLNRPPEEGWKGRLPPQRQPTLPYPHSERLGVPNGGNGARSRSPSPVRSEISNGDEVEVGRERGRSPSPALSMASSNGGGEGLRHVRSVSASTVTTSTTGRRPTLKRQPSQGLPSHPGVHRRGTSVGPTATTTATTEDKNPEVPPQQPSPETPIPPVPTPQPVEAPAPPVATEPPPVVVPIVPDEPPVPATPPVPAPPPSTASPVLPPPQVPQVGRTKSILRAPSPTMGPPVPQMPAASSSSGPNAGLVPKKSILKNSSSFDRSASPQPSYPPHVRSASASTTVVGSRKSAVLPRPSSAFRQDPSAGAPPMPSSTIPPQRPASPALSNASEPPPAPPRNPMRQRSMNHSRSMSNLQAPRPAMPLRPSSPALSAASEPPSQTQSQPGGPPKRPPRPLSHARSLSSLKNPPAQLAPPLPAPNRAPSPSPMLMGGAGSGGGEHGRSASTGEALPTDVVRGLRSRANSVTGKRPVMPELVPF